MLQGAYGGPLPTITNLQKSPILAAYHQCFGPKNSRNLWLNLPVYLEIPDFRENGTRWGRYYLYMGS